MAKRASTRSTSSYVVGGVGHQRLRHVPGGARESVPRARLSAEQIQAAVRIAATVHARSTHVERGEALAAPVAATALATAA